MIFGKIMLIDTNLFNFSIYQIIIFTFSFVKKWCVLLINVSEKRSY